MRLVTIPDNPVPAGAVTGMLRTPDGTAVRYARWPAERRERGTACLLQGRAEFIEKYFEVVQELRSRGLSVIAFDWRGQGLSDRALADPHKGHVESFRQYDTDLQSVMTELVLPSTSRPLIGIAHSMGGAVMLRAAAAGNPQFDRMVLTSPMVGLPYPRSTAFARAVFRVLRRGGFGTSYVPGGRATIMDLRPFASNRRTSDQKRYARNAAILRVEPALGIGSPTVAWTEAALEAIHDLADQSIPMRIRTPLVIVAAGRDQIASTPASRAFAGRVGATFVDIVGARHEVLTEQDEFRAQFWSAFDSVAGAL